MRVLHLTGSAGVGGIERLIVELGERQIATGSLHPEVLFQQKSQGGFLEEFRRAGLAWHDLGARRGSGPARYLRVWRLLRRYDVLHIHSFGPLIGLIAAVSGRRMVVTIHGNFGYGRRRTWRDRIKDRVFGFVLRNFADAVACNSAWTLRQTVIRYGVTGKKLSVVYNGIAFKPEDSDTTTIPEEWRGRLSGKFVIGTTGRLAGLKRVDRLIDGYARLRGCRNACLVIVGDGPYRQQLEAQAARLGVGDSVLFTGYQTNARAWQRLMDVCVFPFQNEAFGLVSVEALSSGRPAIVFADGGGITEVIRDLCPEDVVADVAGLARRIEHYRREQPVPEALVNARIRHAQRFNVARMADTYERLYRACPAV